jgi:peptidoglycan/xylan/chitin deacetylase (PgdA/CDA1 family)
VIKPKRFLKVIVLLLLSAIIFGLFDSPHENRVSAAAPFDAKNPKQFQYVNTTGHSISGAVLRYYKATGGATRHGLPLTEVIRHNNRYVQFFERSVIAFHPEYVDTENEVELLPLGKWAVEGRNFPPLTPFESQEERWYFPETGQTLSEGFLDFWRNNGAEKALGLPVSPEFKEITPVGKELIVQYFEYVRLEFHPNDQEAIKIGLLGTERAKKELAGWQLASLPLSKLQEPLQAKVPSLMFHYVRDIARNKDELGFDLSVAPANFTKFLDWLKQNGYNTVTIAQISDYLKYGIPLPPKPVNLRFDDGYSSMWFAYQELKKRNMTATFYIITRKLQLLPEQWRQIDKDGFEVAPHTRTHVDLRAANDLQAEIAGSKIDLELMLGHPVRTFAYPYGKFTALALRVTQNSGYDMAVSTEWGYTWTPGNMFQQPTLTVRGDDYFDGLVAKVQAGNPRP